MEFLASDLRIVFIGTLAHPKNLYCIEASIDPSEKRHSSAQSLNDSRILKCRQLIYNVPQIIASPVFETESRMYIVMERKYFESGEISIILHKMKILVRGTLLASQEIFVQCLRYTLETKIAPHWNQVRDYFVCGRSFLTATEALPAVRVDICVKDSDTFMIVWPTRILLEHINLEEFGISQKLKHEFMLRSASVISENHIGTKYINVLPTLDKGQILQISHHIPETCPYKSYKELKRHWKNMYGYRLPEEEGDIVYYSVAFLNSSTNQVIPSPCVRSRDIILLNQMNPSHILEWFYDTLLKKMPMICGQSIFSGRKLAYAFWKEEMDELNSDLFSDISRVPNLKVTDLIEREPTVFSLSPNNDMEKCENVGRLDESEIKHPNLLQATKLTSEISNPLNVMNNRISSGSENIERSPEYISNHKSVSNTEANKSPLLVPRKPLQDISQVLKLKNIDNWPGAVSRPDIDANSLPLSTKKGIYQENSDNDTRFIQTTFSRIALSTQLEGVVNTSGSQGMQGFYTFPPQNLLMEQTRVRSQACLTFKDMLPSANQQVNMLSSKGQGIVPEKNVNLKRDASMLGQSNILGMVKKKPRSRPQVQPDVDVELVARNNDLQRVNKITLVYWLRNKLVPCKVKDKKSDLVIKVMEYLNLPVDKVQ